MTRSGSLEWVDAYRNECTFVILALVTAILLSSWIWSRTAAQQLAKTENEVISAQTGLDRPHNISTVADSTLHQDFAASLPTVVLASGLRVRS